MNGPRVTTLTALTVFLCGCTGPVMNGPHARTGWLQSASELDQVDAHQLGEQEPQDVGQALAAVARELEIFQVPRYGQMAVAQATLDLPLPSELASLPPPGPLTEEAYKILVHTAEAFQTCVSIHANNVANLETTAFKRQVPILEEYASKPQGSRVAQIRTDFRQGAFRETGNSLDWAIAGKGFFQILDPNKGRVFTRAGNFSVNKNGSLVLGSASRGFLLEPTITIPPGATLVEINVDGAVQYKRPGKLGMQTAGIVKLARFNNPEGLSKLGENLYEAIESSGQPTTGIPGQSGLGVIRGGCLEASNVEPIAELAALTRYLRMLRVVRWLLLSDGAQPNGESR